MGYDGRVFGAAHRLTSRSAATLLRMWNLSFRIGGNTKRRGCIFKKNPGAQKEMKERENNFHSIIRL